MTDATQPSSSPAPRRLTDDEIGERIVKIMDTAAELPDDMPISKNLAAVWAAHLDEHVVSDVPARLVESEFWSAIVHLEIRLLRAERLLKDAGHDLPPIGLITP